MKQLMSLTHWVLNVSREYILSCFTVLDIISNANKLANYVLAFHWSEDIVSQT